MAGIPWGMRVNLRLSVALVAMAIVACDGAAGDSVDTASPGDSAAALDTADSGDTGDSDDTGAAPDADADGAPSWASGGDPLLADCDDADPDVGPDTRRYFPAARFVRGDDEFANTSPAREISLSAYCLDVREVTNADFVPYLEARAAAGMPNLADDGSPLFAFVDDTPDTYGERLRDEGGGVYTVEPGYQTHPVVEVYWAAGEGYCAWAGGRLPTEAEWESAGRGGEQHDFPWGPTAPDCTLENYALIVDGQREPCEDDTTPVGTYPTGASAHGVLDLAGNAAEWVFDWYRADYYAESPEADPQGPDSGWVTEEVNPEGYAARLTRGGNFLTGAEFTTTYARGYEPEAAHSNGIGFRCAQTPR